MIDAGGTVYVPEGAWENDIHITDSENVKAEGCKLPLGIKEA